MIVTNTETVPGYHVAEIKGLVQGNTVRSKHAGRDIAASFKNLVGGELKGYTELLTESRRQAFERMMGQAQQLGANAILNVRFTTSAVTAGAAELYAYGTAVVVQPAS
ncbi:MAG: YbjQ family protein [Planctomycetota bacterium]